MDGIGLCQNGVRLFPQEFLSIVGTHYDGYGVGFHWISMFWWSVLWSHVDALDRHILLQK